MTIRTRSAKNLVCSVSALGAAFAMSACGSILPAGAGEESVAKDKGQEVELSGSQELTLSFGDLAAIAGAEEGKVQASTAPTTSLLLQDASGTVSSSGGSSTGGAVAGSAGSAAGSSGAVGSVVAPMPADAAGQAPLPPEELAALEKQKAGEVKNAGIQTIEVELLLEGQKAASGSIDVSKETAITLRKLAVGAYELKVRMLDSAGKVVLQGGGKAEVKAGEKNVARLRMRPDDKSGSLTIVIDAVEKPKPAPAPGQRGRFLNVFSPFLYLELNSVQSIPGCGEKRITLDWQPGRAQIEVQSCANGKPLIEGYVIDRSQGIHVLRDFLDGMRDDVRLRAELKGPFDPGMCMPGKPVHVLRAKFEAEDRKGVSRVFVGQPECFAGVDGRGQFDGFLPPPAFEKLANELARLAAMLGKRVYSQSPDFGAVDPVPPGFPTPQPYPMPMPKPTAAPGMPTPPPSGDIEALKMRRDAMRLDIKSLVRFDCKADFDCAAIAMGAAPCGGPEYFQIVSRLASPMNKILAISGEERRTSELINQQSGAVGVCLAVLPPKPMCDKATFQCKGAAESMGPK